ncbi:uncharacterized protein FOMMEDRAFT_29301 [Fomitiporia mediterranea MF3/22]|uniref:uncharacterized protein n=1 Tax=Fomitiporia mediterranea (strain MF3/22) TaxID=694068 RepID=UPI0004408E0B|nr:uncharacterized protein FOMMEDRAFT_29301 [Fomitiporia mediterranea MF3/22]EJD02231.1 hypothetical protein FOMMEDRAFT_29301 [Fomitiporia mediterranea MF3/22]
MALQSPLAAPAAPHSQRQAQTFEFTKRKKWTDILVSELPDTVLLILDTDKEIQYVGPNTTDLLGWQVEELVDTDVLDIVNDDDKRHFNNHLQNSLSSRQDLSCHARLKCKPVDEEKQDSQKELLFEVRGHALYTPNDNECKCFLVVAKPYPSRNMAVLNTFLELKIENERLTQRLKELKAQQDLLPASADEHAASAPLTTMTQFSGFEFARPPSSASQSPLSGSAAGGIGTIHTGFVHSTLPNTNPRDDDSEDGSKRKKVKKTNVPAQQYVCVTCGRTDSPEWRKGPKGPKTLCNACGLRWAKRSKQTDDVPIPYVQGGQGSREGHDGGRPSTSASSSSGRGGRGAPVPNAALSVTPTEPPPSSSGPPKQHQQQGRYDTHVSAASPTHTTFAPTPIAPAPPNPGAHYGMHVGIPMSAHPQNAAIQPSPTSAVAHPFSQARTQEQYHQAMYDQQQHHHYSWPPMNQHRDGGYGY